MTAPAHETPVNFPTGETLSVLERLIVAPSSGTFRGLDARPRPYDGYALNYGDIIGEVRSLGVSTPVRSPFAGFLIEVLAVEGERLRTGQRVARVRIADHA